MKSKSRKPTKAELEHILAVKSMGCIICPAPPPSEYHHICDTGRRIGHLWGLPLCEFCHRGNNGFTGNNRSAWDKSLRNQLQLCQKTYKLLGLIMPMPSSKIAGYYERLLD